jgi:RNA polymerase sigma-70 factor (ECF subfamily)
MRQSIQRPEGPADPGVDVVDVLRSGGDDALAGIFMQHRDRLRRMIRLRMDRRLSKRIDVSDVLQEGYLDAARRLPEYLGNPTMPFFVWLRFLVGQRLLALHRTHFQIQKRDLRREELPALQKRPHADSELIALELSADVTSPSVAAARGELQQILRETLDSLDPIDRDILVLRHFEELTNNEAAAELGLTKAAASKRYIKAIQRLRVVMNPVHEA